ncbi:hypothetical protein BC834DRAFT_662461 [Gloeopeniophorella convolvens]|nr:hypothetical protein BC834DRAFT_662461 [Gloeopeniophorella convolvens]
MVLNRDGLDIRSLPKNTVIIVPGTPAVAQQPRYLTLDVRASDWTKDKVQLGKALIQRELTATKRLCCPQANVVHALVMSIVRTLASCITPGAAGIVNSVGAAVCKITESEEVTLQDCVPWQRFWGPAQCIRCRLFGLVDSTQHCMIFLFGAQSHPARLADS